MTGSGKGKGDIGRKRSEQLLLLGGYGEVRDLWRRV